MNANQSLLCDFIRFSSIDGPGNRMVLFLQGCNYNCVACHNPYTINPCLHCGLCVTACTSGALSLEGGEVHWKPSRCKGDEACIRICPFDSTPKARSFSLEQALNEIRHTAPFLSGITVSGGEATLQWPFVRALFAAIKSDASLNHLSTLVDSNGSAPLSVWEQLLPVMDGAMLDLKCFDNALHQELTAASNQPVLNSIRFLQSQGKLHEVRLLLLPGRNDDAQLLKQTAAWLAAIDPAMRIKIIGFRPHGVRAQAQHWPQPTAAQMQSYTQIFAQAGLTVQAV